MSFKRKLTSAAVVSAAVVTPFLASTPAMAQASIDPNLDYFNLNVDPSSLVAPVASKPLCAATFVG